MYKLTLHFTKRFHRLRYRKFKILRLLKSHLESNQLVLLMTIRLRVQKSNPLLINKFPEINLYSG